MLIVSYCFRVEMRWLILLTASISASTAAWSSTSAFLRTSKSRSSVSKVPSSPWICVVGFKVLKLTFETLSTGSEEAGYLVGTALVLRLFWCRGAMCVSRFLFLGKPLFCRGTCCEQAEVTDSAMFFPYIAMMKDCPLKSDFRPKIFISSQPVQLQLNNSDNEFISLGIGMEGLLGRRAVVVFSPELLVTIRNSTLSSRATWVLSRVSTCWW